MFPPEYKQISPSHCKVGCFVTSSDIISLQFDISHVKASFIRSLVSRKNIEKSDRLRHCHKVDYIESYCYAICSIRDATYDYDPG